MFSNITIGFLLGAGFAAWVYSKIMRSSGGNTKNSLIVAGVAGLFAAVILITLLGIFV